MRNQDQQPPPAYSLHSVDNVLRLMQMLRDTGCVRLKDVAADLGVAPPTAHRLLSMLVYRGVAVQDDSRRYLPGPGLGGEVREVDKGDLVVVPSWTARQIQAETDFDLFRFGDQPIVEKLNLDRAFVQGEEQ